MSGTQATSQKKVAFVTGAASGIGYATALAFAQEGYAVAVIDRNEEAGRNAQLALSDISECRFFQCDVTDDAAVKRAVDATVDAFGRLDVAFNAAGMDGEVGPLTAECSMENWNAVIAVNLTSTFSCMRYQIPHMLAAGGGAIVNCSSVAGIVGAPKLPAYVAAKHGIVGLTKAAALEYAAQGIAINAVCPCMIATPMHSALAPEIEEMMKKEIPIGRYGAPDDVAKMVVWLCHDNSGFVTGQAISIDGGWTTR